MTARRSKRALIGMVASVALVCVAAPVGAQVKSGTYAVSDAATPKGKTWTGAVTVKTHGKIAALYRYTSTDGGKGVGMLRPGALWAAYGVGARLVVFKRGKRGSLRGVTASEGNNKPTGTITARRLRGGAGYSVTIRDAAGKVSRGTMTMVRDRGAYAVTVRTGGMPWTGVGYEAGRYIGVAWHPSARLWFYDVDKSGRLVGAGPVLGAYAPHREKLRPLVPLAELGLVHAQACKCADRTCANIALRAFHRAYLTFKDVPAGGAVYDRIKQTSSLITRCLMNAGVTGEEVMKIFK